MSQESEWSPTLTLTLTLTAKVRLRLKGKVKVKVKQDLTLLEKQPFLPHGSACLRSSDIFPFAMISSGDVDVKSSVHGLRTQWLQDNLE